MLLGIHISVALLGLVAASLAAIAPSRGKVAASYGLLAATLSSGTVLVQQLHTALASACFSGLAYSGFVAVLLAVARYRLAHVTLTRK